MSEIQLYYFPVSPHCRSVLLALKSLNLEVELKEANIMEGGHLTEDFLAINPQHCLPTIVDGDFVLWESRAILQYLASKYGSETEFYSEDAEQKAKIDRLLFFDMGTLSQRFSEYMNPVLFEGENPDSGKLARLQEALRWLNTYLEDQEFTAGEHITIADFALVASVSSIMAAGIDFEGHDNVVAWLNRCQEQMEGYEEANAAGADQYGHFVKAKMALLQDVNGEE